MNIFNLTAFFFDGFFSQLLWRSIMQTVDTEIINIRSKRFHKWLQYHGLLKFLNLYTKFKGIPSDKYQTESNDMFGKGNVAHSEISRGKLCLEFEENINASLWIHNLLHWKVLHVNIFNNIWLVAFKPLPANNPNSPYQGLKSQYWYWYIVFIINIINIGHQYRKYWPY